MFLFNLKQVSQNHVLIIFNVTKTPAFHCVRLCLSVCAYPIPVCLSVCLSLCLCVCLQSNGGVRLAVDIPVQLSSGKFHRKVQDSWPVVDWTTAGRSKSALSAACWDVRSFRPVQVKPVSQLRFDYDTTTIRLRRKINLFIFCSRLIGSRRVRYVDVGS